MTISFRETAPLQGLRRRFFATALTPLSSARDGLDTIMNFRCDEEDVIRFLDRRLDWSDLDRNGNGTLDDIDPFVEIAGGGTRMDHGAASAAAIRRSTAFRWPTSRA